MGPSIRFLRADEASNASIEMALARRSPVSQKLTELVSMEFSKQC
jgi:hypothetical protein